MTDDIFVLAFFQALFIPKSCDFLISCTTESHFRFQPNAELQLQKCCQLRLRYFTGMRSSHGQVLSSTEVVARVRNASNHGGWLGSGWAVCCARRRGGDDDDLHVRSSFDSNVYHLLVILNGWGFVSLTRQKG